MNIRFLSLADQEVDDAVRWYEKQEEGLSRDFLDELDRTVRLVKAYPLLAKQIQRVVTIGLLDKSPVHPCEVFADVIADRAAAVIFVHNHPSGDPQPSDADRGTQNQLTEAAKILGLRVLDNIIVTRKGYFSFLEAGLIP